MSSNTVLQLWFRVDIHSFSQLAVAEVKTGSTHATPQLPQSNKALHTTFFSSELHLDSQTIL